MIPGDSLNPLAPISEFLSPDSIVHPWVIDYENGGVALNDGSLGLTHSQWVLYTNQNEIYVKKITDTDGILVLTTTTAPTEISFSFDSNMQIVIGYVENFVTKLYWFDTVSNSFITSTFPGIKSPRLCMDDKRPRETYSRDILFFYIKEGTPNKLCYRQQRDRYTIERELMEISPLINYIGRVGMATTNRIQVELLSIISGGPMIVIVNT
jgi:hypothetical protein